jgi:uncharacterized protein
MQNIVEKGEKMKNETYIHILKEMKFKNPVVVEGLPGIGLVGKIAAKHLAKELKATRIAEIYSPHFPHQVIMKKDGTIRMLRNVVYGYKKGKKEIIIVIGDVQAVTSEAQFEVTNKMLDYFESLNVKEIITLGGYGKGSHVEKTRVLGSTTHKKLIKKYEKKKIIFREAKGTIIGAAGMLLGIGKLRGFHGVCLMGETHGAFVDHTSAKEVLKVLCNVLGVKVNLNNIDKQKAKHEKMVKEELNKLSEIDKSENFGALSYIR